MCVCLVLWKETEKKLNSSKERDGCVCVLQCASLCMSESVFIFGLSGLIVFIDSLKKTKQKITYLSCTHTHTHTHWYTPCSLPSSPLSLIISKVNVLSCYIVFRSSSQTTTFEKLTGSIVPLVSAFLAFLASSCASLSSGGERLVLLHHVFELLSDCDTWEVNR